MPKGQELGVTKPNRGQNSYLVMQKNTLLGKTKLGPKQLPNDAKNIGLVKTKQGVNTVSL